MEYRTLNPTTEKLVRSYPEDGWDRARAAAGKGGEAYRSWGRLDLKKRKDLVLNLVPILRARKEAWAEIMTEEMGKPIVQAETEAEKCAWGCEYVVESAEQALRESPIATDAAKSYVRYDPLGVILGIMPWNFPFWQVFRFSIPALMAGNVVLLKHAPNVPGCAKAIAGIFKEAGFPEGVFQSLLLSNENTGRLIESGLVQGVSLTGSDRAGSQVAAVAGKSLVKTVLELGGSDPFVVFEDADLSQAVQVGIRSRMLNGGQSCIAAKRFLVDEKILPQFQEALIAAVKGLRVGDPKDRATDIGPLAREDLLQNLSDQVRRAEAEGARLLCGGGRPKRKGFFYNPAVLTEVKPGMVPFEQEVFGPVVSLISFRTEEEAIVLANQTAYGLGASLWTRDLVRAERLAKRIEAGSVFVNGMVKSDPRLPFGGIKRSGYGRELSTHGMHEFVNIKTVWIG